MIKYVELNIGETEHFEDGFGNFFDVVKKENGYFIFDETYDYGPYQMVLVDVLVKDIYACGRNGRECDFFNAGIDGIVSKEQYEVNPSLKKELKELQVREELKKLPGCKFVGEVDLYKLKKNPNGPFAKKDGLTRIWLQGKLRHIFQTEDGKYFVINPEKEISPIEKYCKFDSYEELSMQVNSKGFEYSSLARSQNKSLAELFHALKYNRAVPNKYIKKIFDKLKEIVGLEEFQNLKSEVKCKKTEHKLVDLKELFDALAVRDIKLLADKMGRTVSCRTNSVLPHVGVEEIETVIDELPSTITYKQMEIEYEGKQFTVMLNSDESICEKAKDKKYYDWQGMYRFSIEKPMGFEEICEIESKRIQDALFYEKPIAEKIILRDPLIYNDDETENE